MPKNNLSPLYFFAILLISCHSEEPQITFSRQQLNLNYEIREHWDYKMIDRFNQGKTSYSDLVVEGIDYGMNQCECTYNNNLVEIKLSSHLGLVGHELRIAINDSIFNSIYEHYGDIKVTDFVATPIRQGLILNTNEFQLGRAIYGAIDFEGIVFTDLLRDVTAHNVKLLGNFGCVLGEKKEGW